MTSLGRRMGIAIAAGALCLAAGAQAGVVVKSSGPSAGEYPVGRQVDDAATITLREGDTVTILTKSGTRVLRGPGSHKVAAQGASQRSKFAALTRKRTARVRTGAVRGGALPPPPPAPAPPPSAPAPSREAPGAGNTTTGVNGNANMGIGSRDARFAGSGRRSLDTIANVAAVKRPNLWYVDVTEGGRTCLPGTDRLTLWRPVAAGEQGYRLARGEDGVSVRFRDGEGQAMLPLEELPAGDDAALALAEERTGETVPLELVEIEDADDPEALAGELIAKGCDAQLEILVERLTQEAPDQ